MKKVLISVLLLIPAFVHAEKKPTPDAAAYTITVHVQACHLLQLFTGPVRLPSVQHLDVLIDGKKYELEAIDGKSRVLPAGDYQAKVTTNSIYKDNEYSRVYELRFPDGSTRKYTVVGEIE